MRNEQGGVFRVHSELAELLGKRPDGGASAADLEHIDEVALVVNVEHGLDVEQTADKGCRCAHAPAALEIDQIIHGEPVADMQAGVFTELCDLLYGGAVVLLLHRQVDQKAVAG